MLSSCGSNRGASSRPGGGSLVEIDLESWCETVKEDLRLATLTQSALLPDGEGRPGAGRIRDQLVFVWRPGQSSVGSADGR